MPPLSQPVFKQVLKMIGDTKVKREEGKKNTLKLSAILSRRKPRKHITKAGEKAEQPASISLLSR